VHDLARRRVLEGRRLRRLMLGQIPQDPARQRRIEPEQLQRGDDRVAAEGGREPRDAGVGVRARRQLGREQGEIGAGPAEPLVEHAAGAPDRAAAAAHRPRRMARPGGRRAEAAPRGPFSGLEPDLEEEVGPATGREGQVELGGAARKARRCEGEGERGGERQAVESLVAQDDGGLGHGGGQQPPPRHASKAANLEHVAEIGGEIQPQRDARLDLGVVPEPQALVEAALPDQAGPLDMDHALPRRRPADRRQGPVGEVGPEQHAVLADRAPEQRQRPTCGAQAEAGQEPRVVVEQAVAVARDVAEGVGDDERVPVLQGEQAQRCARLARARLASIARVRGGLGHQFAYSGLARPGPAPLIPRQSRR
jgi:hypothetical protein